MPALTNPRWERFAQCILDGLLDPSRETYSNGRAYQRAGYLTSNRNASDAAASRLLRKVKPIMARVRELQAELAEQAAETREKCVAELNELRREARAEKAYGPAVSAVMGKAKILNFVTDNEAINSKIDFNSAESMQDIGRKLLQSIGFNEPDDVSVEQAVEANDRFIGELVAIRDRAQTLTIE
jgi:tetrahydromethanopterin S-methyltransferase subunit G